MERHPQGLAGQAPQREPRRFVSFGGSTPPFPTKKYSAMGNSKNTGPTTWAKDIDRALDDIIMDRPRPFAVGGRRFELRHPSLGRTILSGRAVDGLGINGVNLSSVAKAGRKELCRLLSVNVSNRCDLFDESRMKELDGFFDENLDDEELASLVSMIMSMYDLGAIMSKYGMDKDREDRKRAAKAKECKNGHNIGFGGKTVAGSLIEPIAKKFGWTVDYIVWGISYAMLWLLVLDGQESVYLTKDEIRKARINEDGVVISGDSRDNWKRIHEMLKG